MATNATSSLWTDFENVLDELSQGKHNQPALSFIGLLALIAFFSIPFVLLSQKKATTFRVPQLYDEAAPVETGAFEKLIRSGFQTHKDKLFKIKEVHGETVVLPTKFMEELRALPGHKLNLGDEIDEKYLSEYSLITMTGVGGRISTVVNSIKNQLTKSLGNMMGLIYEETVYGFKDAFPECDDWTEVDMQSKLCRIVALVSGRVFVGLPMSRNEEYLESIIMFTLNVWVAAPEVRAYPTFLRWASRWLNPKVREVHKSLATMKRLMDPIIRENRQVVSSGELPYNMAAWNLKNSNEKEWNSDIIQSHMQLVTSMAAVHTTSMVVTNAIFDLAARPEYIQPLRDEIAAVKGTESTPYLNKVSMPKMRKLDSFIKESHRLYPISVLNMRRKILQPITLHDGTLLPAGTHIAFPLHQIAYDAELWENPDEFEGFRFQRLRDIPGNESKFQFTTTGTTNLDFGHGTHACPGRFFAANEIKMMLVHLIENYDFRFPEGVERPRSLWQAGNFYPDPSVKVLVKRRG